MVKNWNQLLSKFIFLHKHLEGNLWSSKWDRFQFIWWM